MIENWKDLIGKRILLRRKYLSTTSITEATVVEISESRKYVKFKWESGSESWQVPEDEYSFSFDKLLEVLGPTPEEREAEKKSEEEKAYTQKMLDRARARADEKDQTIHITVGGIQKGTFADKILPNAEETVPETTKLRGAIKNSELGGERPFGLRLIINLENGNGVDWVIAKDLKEIYQFCRDAKVEYINELVGKPVECIFEGDGGAGCRILECKIRKEDIVGPDIVSNPLTGKIELKDDGTSPMPESKLDSTSIKYKIDNF